MAYANASGNHRGFGQTMRPDAWWVQPSLTFLALSAFVVYATWAAFQGAHYHYASNGANYHCTLHPDMVGAVSAASGAAPPPCEGQYC